ncbi:MAG: hypothetical protein WAV28_04595 [Sedimentisphaerales bacterium]
MNKKKNEKWLDELISRTINTGKPQFDPEKWKQKYPDEFQTLLSRAAKRDSARQPSILKVILKSPLTKLAAAAVIIVGISFFIAHQGPSEQGITTKSLKTVESPSEIMTMKSLTIAYRRSGIEGIENQCEKALKILGPQPASVSLGDLFNGSKS